MQVTRFTDLATLTEAAAARFAQEARSAIEERGRFLVALSGGNTPRGLYRLLAQNPWREEIPWEQVHFLFGDERFVPADHAESNEAMAREALLSHIHPAGAHGIVRYDSPEECADYYEEVLRDLLGPEERMDLTLLGLGADGHTASLFPGDPSIHDEHRFVRASKASAGIPDRITLTPHLLNRSRSVLFLIAGADKGPALERLIEGPEDWIATPAQAVARHAEDVELFVAP